MEIKSYVDKALDILQQIGLVPKKEKAELTDLLQQNLAEVDEPKVLAISRTLDYMHSFNDLVRENVSDMKVGTRYQKITDLFDSVITDSKTLLAKCADGQIDTSDKIQMFWMNLTRGSTHKRFGAIVDTYKAVSRDVKGQLEKETAILGAYDQFKSALKQAEGWSYELLSIQEKNREIAQIEFNNAAEAVNKETDAGKRTQLELARDDAQRNFEKQDRNYQLAKDLAENFKVGYSVSDVLMTKLKQTHDVKTQVYSRAVTFFNTNESVFTTMDANFTSTQGLNEATETVRSMENGANKALDALAEMTGDVEKRGISVGYGVTLNPASIQKLVDAIVKYQGEAKQLIEEERIKCTEASNQSAQIASTGREQLRRIACNYQQLAQTAN
jgi:hypothetical protein